jgi:hypothetical protein
MQIVRNWTKLGILDAAVGGNTLGLGAGGLRRDGSRDDPVG